MESDGASEEKENSSLREKLLGLSCKRSTQFNHWTEFIVFNLVRCIYGAESGDALDIGQFSKCDVSAFYLSERISKNWTNK